LAESLGCNKKGGSSQQFKLIAENTDKNTDKKTVQSGEREGDGMEVVEKLGCGGLQSPTTFNISFRVDLA